MYQTYCLNNTRVNLKSLYTIWKGKVWINGENFYNRGFYGKQTSMTSVDDFRNRIAKAGYIYCPEEFYTTLELRNYSINTAKNYIHKFECFLNNNSCENLMEITENDIRDYLKRLVIEGRSSAYINLMINTIKFYFEKVCNMPKRFYAIERPKKTEKLPKVLSLQEIEEMIKATKNLKHNCILILLYSSGLRRSELLNLKIVDIDSKRMIIWIRNAKGAKDRYTLLSPTVLESLRTYYKAWKPKKYLFEGNESCKYSASSLRQIVLTAGKKAKINKTVTPHMLRHSFATHLLENGTNLRYIQSLLGHKSSQTTEIYTQVSTNHIKQIQNPIELLNLGKTDI